MGGIEKEENQMKFREEGSVGIPACRQAGIADEILSSIQVS
jgi:hypothetical protein